MGKLNNAVNCFHLFIYLVFESHRRLQSHMATSSYYCQVKADPTHRNIGIFAYMYGRITDVMQVRWVKVLRTKPQSVPQRLRSHLDVKDEFLAKIIKLCSRMCLSEV